MVPEKITAKWIKNASDERAVANGCRFDEERADHFVEFATRHCHLYEGERAGRLVELMPWQEDLFRRLFGWVAFDEDRGRWLRRFSKASVWLPKKNGKSPSGAIVGLYLLSADGEMGAKVFSAAYDVKQASVVHGHARAMVQMSDRLSRECTINRTTGQIAHLPTMSTYSILAGQSHKGQEGLNGSVIIDETHVVDVRLIRRLENMGASRPEPLQFEISTAGDDPQGYGRKQYEYGKSVQRGDIEDDAFLFVSYEAPQDLSDEQCDDIEVWKKANPAWGYTIFGKEFRSTCERSKRSLSDFSSWKKYRLNIWQASSQPWLRIGDWNDCADSGTTREDLYGCSCYLGLDLSKTQDMTAAVLAFPESDDSVRLLPFFWLPAPTAAANNHLAPYLEWAKAGHLELSQANVVDYSFVKRRIIQLCRDYDVRQIIYDSTYAEDLTQSVEDETGVERVEFPQNIMTFAGPTAEFERLVLGGLLRHPGHPILNWQAGNATIRTDVNNNKRPVKPPHDEPRKIDGIVAAIMALAGAMKGEGGVSVYEEGESLLL